MVAKSNLRRRGFIIMTLRSYPIADRSQDRNSDGAGM